MIAGQAVERGLDRGLVRESIGPDLERRRHSGGDGLRSTLPPASQPSAIVADVQSQAARQFGPVIVSAFVHRVERSGEGVIMNSVRSHAPETAYGASAPLWRLTPSAA